MDTIKKYFKLLLLAVILVAGAFAAGRYSTQTKVVTTTTEVKVRDEDYTKQKVEEARAQWVKYTHTTTTTNSIILKPCPPPTTEPYSCKPPCGTDCSKCPMQTISTNTTTTTDTHSSGSSSSNATTNTHGTSHEATTSNTATTTQPASSPSKWSLSLRASADLYDGSKLLFAPTYGASVGYKLLGPLDLSIAAYTNKKVVGSLGLDLGKNWSASVDVGTSLTVFKPFYGGTVGRRVLGPVWVSAWGTSETAFGLAASFRVGG